MSFIYNQLFVSLPYPSASVEGKTIIVTGSNVGLGKEAARHYARLGASKIILAVRNLEKGNAAKDDILSTTERPNSTIEVWQIDMASYDSVKKFVARAEKELERVDILNANAGIAATTYVQLEDNESMVTVNVVSTFLLALLMLPKMKETAKKFKTKPTLCITSSEVHGWAKFEDKNAPEGEIFNQLNDEAKADIGDRYQVSKLLEVFGVRAIADQHTASSVGVTLNMVNPGLCHSELSRDGGWFLYFLKLALARTTEYGSRTLVHGGTSGPETHGAYLSNCEITEPSPSVLSEEGKKVQVRVWDELSKKLERIQPGILKNL